MGSEETEYARVQRAIVRVLRGSRQRMARRNNRLEGAGYILLTCLETQRPARLSDLAVTLRLDASTVSRQVRSLEDAGMLRREPDPDDRRASRVLLSDLGRAELALQGHERHAVLGAAMAGWSDADRAALLGLLERLADDIEAPTARARHERPPAVASSTTTTASREVVDR